MAILTRNEGLRVLPRVLVAPATTTIRSLPTEVHLDQQDGMPRACVLNLDTPELLSRSSFIIYITTLSLVRQEDVCRALAVATGCS
ncbi:MAG: type II toxin-antitoxin system PemK/MazF family toxin [Egibacteraceae bacterium]